MICDDEECARRLVRASLARGDYDVIEAHDGIEGLTLATSERPHLVLLDLESLRADPALAETLGVAS